MQKKKLFSKLGVTRNSRSRRLEEEICLKVVNWSTVLIVPWVLGFLRNGDYIPTEQEERFRENI